MSGYKNADSKTQWFQDKPGLGGADMNLKATTMVVVLHTTEGYSWPSYEGGATAPNYTGQPPLPNIKRGWRQHFPDEKSARALQNLQGGTETNTLNCVQLELIGTCDPAHRKSWGSRKAGVDYVFWPEATDEQKRWVARILADFHVRHGLRLAAPRQFLPYPASYGNSDVRLSVKSWRATTGVVGHQHVPENVHGDPGNIDIDFILAEAKKMAEKRLSK